MSISVLSSYNCGIMSNNLQTKKEKKKKRKKEEEEIVNCYHSISICDDAHNMEIVSTLGDDARNPSLV